MYQNLASLSESEIKSFINSFDTVLCDCDGVLHSGDKPIEGAKETIAKLRDYGKKIGFVSNNSAADTKRICFRLNKFGYDAKVEDVAIPTSAITAYLKRINFNKEVYVVGTTHMKNQIKEAGFTVADIEVDVVEETYGGLAKHMEDNSNVGAVVFDLDLNLSYSKILRAYIYLHRPEVLFITGASDKLFSFGLDWLLIGPKCFQDLLQDLTNRTPLQFGKPSLNFVEYISGKYYIQDPSRTLFVGDSMEQDIEFATKGGFQKLLVLTGITNLDQLRECSDKDRIPDFYINSFGDLNKLI